MAEPARPASPAGSVSTIDGAEHSGEQLGPSESTQTIATTTTRSDHPRVTIVAPEDYRGDEESMRTTTTVRERRDRQSAPPTVNRPTTTRRLSSHRKHTYSVDDNEEEVLKDQRLKSQQQRAEVSRGSISTARKSGGSGPSSLRRRETGSLAAAVPEPLLEEEALSPTTTRQAAEPVEEDEAENIAPEEGMDQTPGSEEEEEHVEEGEQTLKERQEAINETHPFGVKIWKSSLYKKDRSVQKLAEEDVHSAPGARMGTIQLVGNSMWSLIVGWWMSAIVFVTATICFLTFTRSGKEYSRVLWGLSKYLLYPFGQYIRLSQDENYLDEDSGEGRSISEYEQWQAGDIEEGRLFFGPLTPRSMVGQGRNDLDNISEVESIDDSNERTGLISGDEADSENRPNKKKRLFGRGKWTVGRVTFYILFYSIIGPMLFLVSTICWIIVFTIPMARVNGILLSHLRRHPLALSFHSNQTRRLRNDHSPVLVCTYRAVGWKYYKYTVDGTNIFLINLLLVVVFVVFDYWVLHKFFDYHGFLTSSPTLFVLALLSIIPLAYFIGLAVASVSAQSSMGLASVLNAFFSTIVEVFLYCVALSQGKGRLVEGSIVGSILAGILLMPGLSMCAGTVFRKTQHFNAQSAEATMTMLLFAVIGAFAPTLFYQIYGTYELKCRDCDDDEMSISRTEDCRRCYFTQPPSVDDPFYAKAVQPFCYTASALLVMAYVIGCLFTLKTHAQLIWATPEKPAQPTNSHSHSQKPRQSSESVGKLPEGQRVNGAASIRESPVYKRVLGQTLNSAGLTRLSAGSAQSSTQQLTPIPESATTTGRAGGSREPVHLPHQKPFASLSTEENESLVRGVAEMVATAAASVSVNAGYQGGGEAGASTASSSEHPKKVSQKIAENAVTEAAAHGGASGHDAPNWSRTKSLVILCGATVLYAAVAEILVSTVDVVLENSSIDEKLLGITLFALVPNTTEFLNAISFAMNGNVALSMEIGSAYALQVCLLQMPALVGWTAWTTGNVLDQDRYNKMFTLIFPQWDMVTVVLCVLMLTNIIHEGKSNYFKGSFLCLSYLTVMLGFYYSGYNYLAGGANEKAQMFDAMTRGGQSSYFLGNKYGHPSNGLSVQG
ncbi:hypothetical protein AOL_s00043g79 [Orbilia oligospora ATCC 24927]|uniref:Uncharacterized protein n=2 Tax=Orbilia oligospora TaxID=2813651 RepID=G1X306_ARTOA|nr:hypothetical protein AOL_s00043g79 [Orbilia oligospora ATCC 24927]EGX52290.1 hypothetical protein AOL_s00043g79 [Orbilia oligospora ATCC 24927]KAF3273991.1 hypothetical protein TWF970_008195 [Orbilia oligospora]